MIVKLIGQPHFTGEYFKTQFIDGVSQEHVNLNTFDQLRDVLGVEPMVIEEDVKCSRCAELEEELKKLKKKLKE